MSKIAVELLFESLKTNRILKRVIVGNKTDFQQNTIQKKSMLFIIFKFWF